MVRLYVAPGMVRRRATGTPGFAFAAKDRLRACSFWREPCVNFGTPGEAARTRSRRSIALPAMPNPAGIACAISTS